MFKFMLEELLKGNLLALNYEIIINRTMALLYAEFHTKDDIEDMKDIIMISNILYNNTDLEMLPLEDGVYDLLLELYRRYNPNVPVGAPVIKFENTNQITSAAKRTPTCPIVYVDDGRDDMVFMDEILSKRGMVVNRVGLTKPITYIDEPTDAISKITVSTEHKYPELAGTLEKCKFVLNVQADDKGVLDDPKVKIFERDFIQKHIAAGLYDWNTRIKVALELKYDGISVITDTTNKIESGFSRGDTDEGLAADLSHIVKNYMLPNALKIPDGMEPFGIKWEAILTYPALKEYSRLRDKNYKNPRNTIAGIFNALDGADFVNLITLVPIASSLGLDRELDIEFLNKYYAKDEKLRYVIVEGTPMEILFYVKRFVDEAELMRDMLPFMYDGVVFSYLDQEIIDKLGRKNSTNQYSVAIKFNPKKKQTIVRGVSFTVGQNGAITPMLHYDPVEFFGTIQTKCTLHSRDRFMNHRFRYGDIVDLAYNNDVMIYATKPDNSHNAENQNPEYEFPTLCPECGSLIRISDTGKSAYCDNTECKGRIIAKAVNMLDKLSLKDFAEAQIRMIGKYTFEEMLLATPKDLEPLGEVMAKKFLERMNEIKITPIEDFKIVGSLGFTNIAKDTWKKIFNVYNIQEIFLLNEEGNLYNALINISGIGPSKATTVVEELPYFLNDIEAIQSQLPVIETKGVSGSIVIRCSGFRNAKLMSDLVAKGFDADDNAGVTKKTDILLVPSLAYSSPKVDKALEYGIKIIPLSEFLDNMDSYIF